MREYWLDPDRYADDAPDNCVICDTPLSDDNDTGEVPDQGDGGLTCSPACHAEWLVRDAKHRAEEKAADDARSQHWLESEREPSPASGPLLPRLSLPLTSAAPETGDENR